MISNRSDLGLIKNESEILYESNENIYYGILDADDIKEILYYDSSVSYDFDSGKNNEQKKLIYISNDDKLVLLDKDGKEVFSHEYKYLQDIALSQDKTGADPLKGYVYKTSDKDPGEFKYFL